ncbi:Late embryogenesis abundant protein 31 [Zea mays]|uniref:Late embryogenesis abundant protein 31 n=1 Tax=Zea mays TaxID=4577 RepID=A0A1D6GGB1_MAIZE|nr:Late embryogenesis abundant protein 31 [Zea mays]
MHAQDKPVKFGDVLDVSGELDDQPVAPRDAARLQAAEQSVPGGTQKGGPAAVLQSVATVNARAGHVGRAQTACPVADAGATITETELAGRRVVTESVGGQVVGKMVTPAPVAMTDPPGALEKDAVTIGRALEAVGAMVGDRPVEQSDAAAVQVAELCATGSDSTNAREKLPADKGATWEDAERVVSAEIRNKLDMATTPGGMADAVTTAARLNQERPRP